MDLTSTFLALAIQSKAIQLLSFLLGASHLHSDTPSLHLPNNFCREKNPRKYVAGNEQNIMEMRAGRHASIQP